MKMSSKITDQNRQGIGATHHEHKQVLQSPLTRYSYFLSNINILIIYNYFVQ